MLYVYFSLFGVYMENAAPTTARAVVIRLDSTDSTP